MIDHTFGKGRTRLVGTFPSAARSRAGDPVARRGAPSGTTFTTHRVAPVGGAPSEERRAALDAFFAGLLDWAGITPHVRTDNPAVIARLHQDPQTGGYVLWALNPTRSTQRAALTLSGDAGRHTIATPLWPEAPRWRGSRTAICGWKSVDAIRRCCSYVDAMPAGQRDCHGNSLAGQRVHAVGLRGAPAVAPLQAPPLPRGDHQPRRVAVLPLPAELSGRRGAAGGARDRGQLRDHPPLVPEVRAGVRRRAAPAPPQPGRQVAPSTRCSSRSTGSRHWLWRAVDQDGMVLDILVQQRRNQEAAEAFLRRLVDGARLPSRGW